jgi:hypothetical protein
MSDSLQVPSGIATPLSVGTPTEAKNLLPMPGQRAATGDHTLQRVQNVPGYSTPVFTGKEEQRAKVQANVAAQVSTTTPIIFIRIARASSIHMQFISSRQ